MNGPLEFPINGVFVSARGTNWHFTIYSNLRVEQWHHANHSRQKRSGGWTDGRDVWAPKCTNELKEYIKIKYDLDVRD